MLVGGEPVLENVPDLIRNSERASIPCLEPRITDSVRDLEAFTSMLWCWLYIGQSLKMWFLVSSKSLSQGQEFGSGDRGRKASRVLRHRKKRPRVVFFLRPVLPD